MNNFTVDSELVWMWKETDVALCKALTWGAEDERNIINEIGRCIGRDSNLGPRLLDITYDLEKEQHRNVQSNDAKWGRVG
jgi:hypothetical protein